MSVFQHKESGHRRSSRKLIEECGDTCIVPICSWNDRQHHHSGPLDPFTAHAVVEQAAEMERCMVFSTIKGTVNLDPDLLLNLYFNIFDNISKTGIRKIILYYRGDECVDFETLPSYPDLYSGKPYTLYHVKPATMHGAESCVNGNLPQEKQQDEEDAVLSITQETSLSEHSMPSSMTPKSTIYMMAVQEHDNPKKAAIHLASIIKEIKSRYDKA